MIIVQPLILQVDMEDPIAKLIYELRTERGWTMRDLAEKVGMAHTGVSRRESGDFKRWGNSERKRFAAAFGISLNKFDGLWQSHQINQSKGGHGIPVINRAPAGKVVDYEEYGVDSGQGFEYIDQGDLKGDHLFAVIVAGDSMEPTVYEGDYLIFEPMDREFSGRGNQDFKSGSLVFVRFDHLYKDGGCTIARAHPLSGGSFLLAKDNTKHPVLTVQRDQIIQMAVGIERRTKRGI